LKNYGGRVDGIITFCDNYKACVAKVAQELRLPTSDPKALNLATDKHSLSVFEKRVSYRVPANRDAALHADKIAPSVWPVMVKPCIGVGSNGCFRGDNASTLVTTFEMISRSGSQFQGTEFVIEPFCSGPEVIVNFVLLGGKILFSDFQDVLPKTAERGLAETRETPTFVEQDLVVPSKLPRNELDLLRKNFHNSLLRLGLTDGVFHLEGRVKHSSMEYVVRDGVYDLRDVEGPSPSSWLIEINPRPPGSTVPELTQYTHGIDYRSLALLLALGDQQRVEALSQPFYNALRCTIVMVVIPVDFDLSCEGIFESEDMCAALLVRRPDLAKHVIDCGCFLKNGDRVFHPSSGSTKWLAYFHVISLSGRTEALQLAQEVRREVRYRFR
jgi:biotin carboxylase